MQFNYIDVNGCTAATATSQNITINAFPVPTISPTTACAFSNGNVYTTQPGMNNYVWTITGDISHISGNTNSVTVNWGAAGTGSIQVTYNY